MYSLVPWRTFSIFISSSFADMQAERDYLKHIIFPRINEELQKRRIRLDIVDLRWGVDTSSIEQEEERESTVLKVCLNEIKRCRPFFIGLLGDRYGWVPTEERMKSATDEEQFMFPLKNKSVTALEIEFGVLASQEQLSRSVFYFREPLPYTIFSPEKAAMFSVLHNPRLSEEEKKIQISALDNLKFSIRQHFEKNGTPNKVKTYSAIWDKEAQKIKGLEAWGEMVYKDIIAECEKHAEDTWEKVPKTDDELEEALFDSFVNRLTDTFCGREELLNELKQHLLSGGKSHWGLFLTGESGSGKSAVFSMTYKMLQKEDCVILTHSAGISHKTKSVTALLQKWNRQLYKNLGIKNEGEKEFEVPELMMWELEGQREMIKKAVIEKLQERFKKLLFSIAEQKHVVLLIDSLDSFEPTERAQYMTWLPDVMPSGVSMLCTAITGSEKNALQYHKGIKVKDIDKFSDKEAKDMLETLCKKQHKNLPVKVAETILKKQRQDSLSAASSPLWLSLAVNILMALDQDDFEKISKKEGRGDKLIEDYLQKLAHEFSPLPGELFMNLISKAGIVFGEIFTINSFLLIACSRNGLRENDLQVLIPKSNEVQWDPLQFACIRRWFHSQLTEQGENQLWNLNHSILRNSLIEKIGKSERIHKAIHNNIAFYLLSLADTDRLRITETMYHLIEGDSRKEAVYYYVSARNDKEIEGSTNVLSEYIIHKGDTAIEWIFSMIYETFDNFSIFHTLARRFIYNLNDALSIDGRLNYRKILLEKLKKIIEQKYGSNIPNEDFGIDKGTLYTRLGYIYQSLGQFDKAIECFELSNKLANQLYKANPKSSDIINNLALSCQFLGQIYNASGQFDKALDYYKLYNKLEKELYETSPLNEIFKYNLSVSYQHLGSIFLLLGQFDKALEYTVLYNRLINELYNSNPDSEKFKETLAVSYDILGIVNKALGRYDKALQSFDQSTKLSKELYKDNPKNEDFKNSLAVSYQHIGLIHSLLGQLEKALEYFELSYKLSKELYETNPLSENLKDGLAYSSQYLGKVYKELGKFDIALEYFKLQSQLLKELYETNPQNENNKSGLAFAYLNLGILYQDSGDIFKAFEFFELQVRLGKELYEANPQNEKHKFNLTLAYERMGVIYESLGRFNKALEYFELRLRMAKELYDSNPESEDLKDGLAISYQHLGVIHQSLGNLNKSHEYFKLFNKIEKELHEANPNRELLKHGLAVSYEKLGGINQSLGHFDKALEYFLLNNKLEEELFKSNPQSHNIKNSLIISCQHLGNLYKALGQLDKAREYFVEENKLSKI